MGFITSNVLEGIQEGKWWEIDYSYLKFQVLGLNLYLTYS